MLMLFSGCARFLLTALLSLSLVSILVSNGGVAPDEQERIVSDSGSLVLLVKTSGSMDDDADYPLIRSTLPLNFIAKTLFHWHQVFVHLYRALSLYPARAPPFFAG